MKKVLTTLLVSFILIFSLTSTVLALNEQIKIKNASGIGSTVYVSGETDGTIPTAVVIQVFKKGESSEIAMNATAVNSKAFSTSFYTDLVVGEEYTVKVADYNGGTWFTKDFIAKANPSPESKKDESCEKVVGPTWHWNNTKGVCEEYALVRTSTR